MRAMVTSGFAMRRRTCRPAAPTHPRKRRDRYFRYNGEFSKKGREKREGKRARVGERGRERAREREWFGSRVAERVICPRLSGEYRSNINGEILYHVRACMRHAVQRDKRELHVEPQVQPEIIRHS